MAVSLGTIGIEAIFTIICSVASLASCNKLNEPKNT